MNRMITILDTNVVSEPMQPDSVACRAGLAGPKVTKEVPNISSRRSPWLKFSSGSNFFPEESVGTGCWPRLKRYLLEDFAGRVLPFDEDAARAFPADCYAASRARPSPRGPRRTNRRHRPLSWRLPGYPQHY